VKRRNLFQHQYVDVADVDVIALKRGLLKEPDGVGARLREVGRADLPALARKAFGQELHRPAVTGKIRLGIDNAHLDDRVRIVR
jgi:hypothetical protein